MRGYTDKSETRVNTTKLNGARNLKMNLHRHSFKLSLNYFESS